MDVMMCWNKVNIRYHFRKSKLSAAHQLPWQDTIKSRMANNQPSRKGLSGRNSFVLALNKNDKNGDT